MPFLQSEHLGQIEYDPADVIHFPQGLPAFEGEREFLALDVPGKAPLVFLQSVSSPGLTFITLPPACIDPGYRLELPEDTPFLDAPLTVLVIVSIGRQGEVTANLLAPVVIDKNTRNAMQVVMAGSNYPVQHPLSSAPGAPPAPGRSAPACS
ncbi:MAG: flagellar assembly protein FliW [Bryobacteraceae bacterium]